MVRTAARGCPCLSVVQRWSYAQPDARATGDAAYDAYQHRRREHAPVQVKAWREIGDVDDIAGRILQAGLQDGRIALVMLAHRVAAIEDQVDEAEGVGRAATDAFLARCAKWDVEAVVIGEEAAGRQPSLLEHIRTAELALVLDPLDGTRNFASGLPLFGMMVAVVQRGPWRLILSKPYSDRLFALLRRPERGFRRRLVALLTAAALSGGLRLPTRGWIYLNVGHTGLDAPGLAAWLARRGWCAVFLVHDLIPLSHPQYCRLGESDKHRARMQTVLSSAAGVIVNSQATAAALADFAHQAGVHAPPVQVAWLASESPIAANRVPDQDRPVFVAIGTIEGRKNHLLLLRLWQRLAQALGPATPQLVLIGQRGQVDAPAGVRWLDWPGLDAPP